MNYKQLYDELMEFRRINVLEKGNHTELHHIIPISISPELANEKSNVVRLTPDEHFKAHYYLMMHYKQIGNSAFASKMGYAIRRMKAQIVTHLNDETLDEISILYKKAREAMPPMSLEQRRKLSQSKKGKKQNLTDEQRRRKGEIARMRFTGKPKSEEHKKHLSESKKSSGCHKDEKNGMYGKGYLLRGERNGMFGRTHSEEAKKKISQINRRPVVVFDLEWNYVCEFPSVGIAEDTLDVWHIGQAITKNRPLNGYRFKYKKDYDEQKTNIK